MNDGQCIYRTAKAEIQVTRKPEACQQHEQGLTARTVFEMPPIGLMSAEEQSYLVRYPLSASSTLALPSTSNQPMARGVHNSRA
jgi:hypothetical protein